MECITDRLLAIVSSWKILVRSLNILSVHRSDEELVDMGTACQHPLNRSSQVLPFLISRYLAVRDEVSMPGWPTSW